MMLKTLELELQLSKSQKMSQSAGSVLHGVIMEHIDRRYAEQLHTQGLRPYTQYVVWDKERNGIFWRISSLRSDAAEEILEPIFALPSVIELRQREETVTIKSKRYIRETSYKELAERYMTASNEKDEIGFRFLTAVGLRQNQGYAVFPQPEKMIDTLLRKWNAFSDADRLEEEQLAMKLASNVFVKAYQLSLHPFAMEQTRIPGFRGMYALSLMRAPLLTKKTLGMLADYAEFSGFGIKTALGMGGAIRIR